MIYKKNTDLDKILSNIDKQPKLLSAEFNNVNSFKLGPLSFTKRTQISVLEEKAKMINNYRVRTKKLMGQLDFLHKNFEWQENPKSVLEKVFEIARIIGEPFINETTVEIEFLFGRNVDRKETIKFVK